MEEPPTADNSEHGGDKSDYIEDVDHIEEYLDTGMPEPGAQTPPQTPRRSEALSESDPKENIVVAPYPRPPETSKRRSKRERTKSTKALANDTQGLSSYSTKRVVITQRIHKVYFISIRSTPSKGYRHSSELCRSHIILTS
jgi:hypothetical protein